MKIVLAVDGSTSSDAAVEEIARRPWPDDSEVRIISVIEPPPPVTTSAWTYPSSREEQEALERSQAEETLSAAAAKLRDGKGTSRLRITAEVIEVSPKRTIVEEAERWSADLIVVGAHGYRSWEEMLLGSVSQAVAQHARCSVEIVRKR